MATTKGNHSYTYDDNYQLTNVTYPDSSTTTYNYDELGNRITVTEGGATDTYASNNLNQYTQVNSTTLSYDLNGSLTGDGSWTYDYDYEGRMVSTEKIGSSVSYSYDDFGRRIKKNVNSLITNYLYDGSQCILEKDNGSTTQARYVYGSRIDEPIIMIREGNTYYYHFDGLGNVVDITDRNGVTVESYTYDVFGKVSIENPHVNPPIPNPNPHKPPRNPRIPSPPQSTGNPYFFTGRRLDTETGLYYYKARYYDPAMGRFISEDPTGLKGGDVNLYTYVKNNPLLYTDPYGTIAVADDIAIVVTIAAAVVIANTDWEVVGQAIGDVIHEVRGWIPLPPPADKPYPPSQVAKDLGIIEPGDPAQWPKFTNPNKIPNWMKALIGLGIIEQILDPYIDSFLDDLDKNKEKEEKEGSNGSK